MGINLSKIKEKLDRVESGGQGQDNHFWKIPQGDSTIRVLPSPTDDPFVDLWSHYSIGERKESFLCPRKTSDENCRVCDFARTLWETEDEQKKQTARDYFAKQRFYANVIVRDEEEKGPQIWSFSKTLYKKILRLVLDPEYGDITDPEQGTDLVVTKSPPAEGMNFSTIDFSPKRSSSKLSGDKKQAKEWIENQIDIVSEHNKKTSEEVAAIMDAAFSGDVFEQEIAKAKDKKPKDLDAALNELNEG